MEIAVHKRNKLFLSFEIIFIFIIIPALYGYESIRLGMDVNWDLRNYHFYNGYAILENRLGYDIAPAQIQTYLNPLLDIPIYELYKNIPSKLVGFIYGSLHGYNISLILLIFLSTSIIRSKNLKIYFGLIIALISSIAPGFLSELGSSMNDNIVSLFTLLAIFLVISSVYIQKVKFRYLLIGIAGFLMGLIIGFKFTAAIFAISIGVFLPIIGKSNDERIKSFIFFSVAGIVGFVTSNGYWMYSLLKEYKSILFPFYNNIFQSPYVISQPFQDSRFHPHNIIEYVFWPIISSLNSFRVSEIKFFDIRFSIPYILAILWMASVVVQILTKVSRNHSNRANNLLFNRRISNFLLLFMAISYIIWMKQFSIYRYIIILELLVPLSIFIILDRIFSNKKTVYISISILIIIGAIFFKPFNWVRIPWSNPYIQVDRAQFQSLTNGVVVMLGTSPASYIIPYFPKDIKFVRPESNFTKYYASAFKEQIMNSITTTNFPIYLLYDKNDITVDLNKSASNLGLDPVLGSCIDIQDNMPDNLVLCNAAPKNQAIFANLPKTNKYNPE